MNFLNPVILFGLGAALLPIAIHLISRRKTRDIEFPSIEFLERMKSNRMRRLQLKQLLVLLLRTLIVILVILAFARPALNSMFNMKARTSAVIIIDGSASMEYVDNGEILFRRALQKARDICDILGGDDTAAIILSTDVPTIIKQGMISRKNELADELNALETPLTISDVNRSFSMALELLDAYPSPNKELYYITDGAENTLPDTLITPKHSVRLYTIVLGPEKRRGGAIESIDCTNELLSPGKTTIFRVSGRLGYDEPEMNVEFFVNGERKGRNRIERKTGDTIETEFSFTPETSGTYSVCASVNDGRFEPGETRRIVINVPSIPAVLLVGDSEQDVYFPEKVLAPGSDTSLFKIKRVLSAEITDFDIHDADIIVLSGVTTFPQELYSSLLNAVVEHGTGLVVFPPADMNKTFYSEGLFRDIFPVQIEKRILVDGKNGSFAVMDWFDTNHPILRGISRGGMFKKPEVRSYVKMRPSGAIHVLGRFNDGSMAFGSAVCGKGCAVVFSVGLSPETSELPLTGIFTPLFIRTIHYLTGTDVIGGGYETDDDINECLGYLPEDVKVSLKSEDGPERFIAASQTDDGMCVKGKYGLKPGFYSVRINGNEEKRFSVDIPKGEVVFKRIDAEKRGETYQNVALKTIEDSQNLTEIVTKDRYGSELFGLFIMFAAILLAVEMIISRKL